MISIIVPTLNEEKFLGQTLRALKKLELSHEVIVSDGGSTDTTLEIAAKFADKIVKKQPEEKQNIAIGRNQGAKAATGDFFVFIDADVEIPEINKFFKKALELFSNEPKLLGLTVFLKVFPEHATLADKFFFQLVNTIHYFSNNWLKIGSASGEFQMIRAEAFKKVGGFNEYLAAGEDVELFSRLARIGVTRVETGLHILHTSRRAHSIGWPKLWGLWFMNNLFFIKFFKRSFSKTWKSVR